MRGNWARMVCAVGLMACLTSGCGGRDDAGGHPQTPAGTTTPTATAAGTIPSRTTVSATSVTTPPELSLPPAATAHTEEGAKAFVAFFIDQLGNSAYRADPAVIAALSGPACKGCRTLIRYADELKAKHHHVDRQSVRLHGQIVYPNSTPDRFVIDALIEDQPSKIVDSQGRSVSDHAGEKFTLRNTVSWSGGAWVMIENLLVTS